MGTEEEGHTASSPGPGLDVIRQGPRHWRGPWVMGLKGTYVTLEVSWGHTLPCHWAYPKDVGSQDPVPPPRGSGATRGASMLDEPALPLHSLDTIFPALTSSVTGEPRDQSEPATLDLLTKALPTGDPELGLSGWSTLWWCVPGRGGGQLAQPYGAEVGSSLASPGPPGPGAGLHLLPPRATLCSPGCHLSGGLSLGQFSPIPRPAFGGFLLGEGLEGHQPDQERSLPDRKGSSCRCAEPPTAGECQCPECAGETREG